MSTNCHLFGANNESSVFILENRLVGINACEKVSRGEVNSVVRFSEADENDMTCVDCVKFMSGEEDYDSWMF